MSCLAHHCWPGPDVAVRKSVVTCILRQQLLSVGLRARLAAEGRQHTPNAFHFSSHKTPVRGHTPSSIRHRQNEQAKNVFPYCHENGVSKSATRGQRAIEKSGCERNNASDRTTTLSAHCKAHSYFEDAIIAYLPLACIRNFTLRCPPQDGP